jgi:Ni,Fe-hydrogenase maturation factor
MFCFSCKYTDNSPLDRCIESILEYHPNEKIVIVDSESENKSYYDRYKSNDSVIILDNLNKHRQPGSFEIIYDKFPDDPYYVMIHDSIIFKKSIQKFLDSLDEFYALLYFPEIVQSEEDKHIVYYRNLFSETSYKSPEPGSTIMGSFGGMAIIKNSLMKRLKNSGILSKLNSTSKWEDENFERVIGICAEQEGYSSEKYNIEGNFLSRYNEVNSDNLEYFTKIFLGRQ